MELGSEQQDLMAEGSRRGPHLHQKRFRRYKIQLKIPTHQSLFSKGRRKWVGGLYEPWFELRFPADPATREDRLILKTLFKS